MCFSCGRKLQAKQVSKNKRVLCIDMQCRNTNRNIKGWCTVDIRKARSITFIERRPFFREKRQNDSSVLSDEGLSTPLIQTLDLAFRISGSTPFIFRFVYITI